MHRLYVRRPEVIRAVYYDGTNAQEICDCGLFEKGLFEVRDGFLVSIEAGQEYSCAPNYYVIIEVETKKITWMNSNRFNSIYKELI